MYNFRLLPRWIVAGLCFAELLTLTNPGLSKAIVLGQIDTFQDGGLDGWIGGGAGGIPSAQMNVPNGGPAGTGDNYLQLSAGGTGGAPRLVGFD